MKEMSWTSCVALSDQFPPSKQVVAVVAAFFVLVCPHVRLILVN